MARSMPKNWRSSRIDTTRKAGNHEKPRVLDIGLSSEFPMAGSAAVCRGVARGAGAPFDRRRGQAPRMGACPGAPESASGLLHFLLGVAAYALLLELARKPRG